MTRITPIHITTMEHRYQTLSKPRKSNTKSKKNTSELSFQDMLNIEMLRLQERN